MKHQLTAEQIAFYQSNGFIIIDNFLSSHELQHFRGAIINAVNERAGKMEGIIIREWSFIVLAQQPLQH